MLGLDAFRRKPRQFNYKPVYFDPAKEARDERRRELFGEDAIEAEQNSDNYVTGSYIRKYGFSRKAIKMEDRSLSSEQRQRNIRRGVITLILLLVLAFYLLYS